MGKRPLENGTADRRPRKAPRKFAEEDAEPPAKINTLRDLRQQLRFSQEDPERLRKGQFSFKDFLKSISTAKDAAQDADRQYKLDILREYLDSNPTDMLQTWSFAAQVDNERLVFAVASTFAQLLRTLSALLDFKDQGIAVAKSLLQREQLKLLSRGLTSDSHKQTIINACLQIVTEIVAFDGGSCAALVFKNQDFLFNSKFLDRNLRLFIATSGADRREVSVRSETIRYILAHLRHQDVEALTKIIDMRSVFRNLLDNLKSDPSHLINEVLRTLETRVLKNQDITRRLKSAIISDRALASIIDHLRNEAHKQQSSEASPEQELTWTLLRNLCTDPDLGVALGCSWYPSPKPKGEDDFLERSVFESADLTSIRNPILSKFIQHLKPHAIIAERELLMSIFQVAPELVADYLRQAGARLNLLPKLTNTWIGYASLLYSMVDLPIPDYLGSTSEYRDHPPPKENVLENILPSPVSRDVLVRCLNQSSSMIRFFATRIMVISLRKLKKLFEMYRKAAEEYGRYEVAIDVLTTDILARLPSIKEVASAYKLIPETDYMSREAAAHLLSLYQILLPATGPDDLFDVAPPLASVIATLQDTKTNADDRSLLQLQLTHLLKVAEHSEGMRWWQRPGTLEYSAFLTIVGLCVDKNRSAGVANNLVPILETAASEDGVLQSTTTLSSMDALLASLEEDNAWTAVPETWAFIDDCINRLIKKPIKYLDDLDDLSKAVSTSDPVISLLTLVVLEQVPFTTRLEAEPRENILAWASRFLTALSSIDEDKKVLRKIKDDLKSQGFKLPKVKVRTIRPLHQTKEDAVKDAPVARANFASSHHIDFDKIPEESDKHPELVRYKKLDAEDLVHNGTLAALLLKPCSSFPEIRKQALAALEDIMATIRDSSLDGKDQLWLLIGELLETSRSTIDKYPLSYIAGAFATAALKVLLDPTHFMFPMVNKYLVKDPYWNVRKLPAYFLDRALLSGPDEDDKHWQQLEWVLAVLVDGLRRVEDVRLLRAANCYERILHVVNGPQVTPAVSALVFKLVHRVVTIDGSAGMAMNAGLLAWLEECQVRYAGESLAELRGLVEEKMDATRMGEWIGVDNSL